MAFSEDESSWDAFLADWPLERLRTMSLTEYTQAGDKNCFTYWMESRLDPFGSIWGGSSFKFGIYSRNDRSPRQNASGVVWDDEYGWYSRFGRSPEEAFERVRQEVVKVAEAARAGSWEEIDNSELGPAYRWKIAFHYQDRERKALIPCVFLRKPLLHACGLPENDRVTPLSSLYLRAAERRKPDESLMSFSRRLWRDWVMARPLVIKLTESAIRNGYVPINLNSAPFPDSARGGKDDGRAGEPLRFRTDTGWEFESDIRAPNSESGHIRTRMDSYFENKGIRPGDVLEIRPEDEGLYSITHRPKHHEARMPAAANSMERDGKSRGGSDMHKPTNKILFGPPGTGKTYRTINETLALLDPEFLAEHADQRPALKARFDELVRAGLVRFVTFHQSFSYEDFIEGIRAKTEDGQIRYEVEDGIFKELCEAAGSRTTVMATTGIDISGRRIWKVSLGDANSEGHVYDACMAEGLALLGFGAGADLSGVRTRAELVERIRQQNPDIRDGDFAVTALERFLLQVKVGDLIVVTHGNLKFRAIGEVTGGYVRPDREDLESYVQGRPVRWLRRYDPPRPYTDLMENRFSQMTIYELHAGSIKMEQLASLLAPQESEQQQPHDHVLIIDEINRGNVSRIFGEVITLIEPSKRAGCDEALEVTLPYSRDRFTVPANVHLIGTMNTADRSLAGIDVALRRRFEFVEVLPEPDALRDIVVEGIPVDVLLSTMNRRIELLMGRDYMLGHAYFMSLEEDSPLDALAAIFRNKVLPLLQEYFFEDWQKIAWVLNDHRKPHGLRIVRQAGLDMDDLLGPEVEMSRQGGVWEINLEALQIPESLRMIIKAELVPA